MDFFLSFYDWTDSKKVKGQRKRKCNIKHHLRLKIDVQNEELKRVRDYAFYSTTITIISKVPIPIRTVIST